MSSCRATNAKAGATYWYLIDDIGWDSDDPRGEVIAELIAALESARRERDEQTKLAAHWSEQNEYHAEQARCVRLLHYDVIAERDSLRAEAEQLRAEQDAAYRDGYDDGWNASGEGHNGEYSSQRFTEEKYVGARTEAMNAWRTTKGDAGK